MGDSIPGREQIENILEQCQKCATDTATEASLVDTLQSLHRALIDLRMPSKNTTSVPTPQQTRDLKLSIASPLPSDGDATPQQEFFYNVAQELINIDRVIFSIHEEINGKYPLDEFEYESDCRWYKDMTEMVARDGVENDISTVEDTTESPDLLTPPYDYDDTSMGPNCHNAERWIDRCLDMCGYAISLEAAVDCLRRIVHDSSSPSTRISSFSKHDAMQKVDPKRPGIAAAVTSLRTIRRRLILPPHSMQEGGNWRMSIPEPYLTLLLRLKDAMDHQTICNLYEKMILPLEYEKQQQTNHKQQQSHQHMHKFQTDQLLSESLSSLALSALPTLVSSACHSMNLPLPSWAAPKVSHGILIHSAWKVLLTGDILVKCAASPKAATAANDFNILAEQSSAMSAAASNHFQLLVRGMIKSGRSEIVVSHLYDCWESCEDSGGDANIQHTSTPLHDLNPPRSILCRQLQSIIASIPSKREVALFTRAILRHCTKQQMRKTALDNFASQQARDQLDAMCKESILPFLLQVLQPSLSKDDVELAEALVNFIILSPPASFRLPPKPSSQSYHTLHIVDRAVPRCLSQLLALAYDGDSEGISHVQCHSQKEDSDSKESEGEESHQNGGIAANAFLAHIVTVASVWSEDVFVTRTDPLQQQYVTEFLLYPLESKQLNQNDLQTGLADGGEPLATLLVQGVSLRLDVSRNESIRIDGMRVAEAMASLLGQTLRFEELRTPGDNTSAGIIENESKEVEEKNANKERKRDRKHRSRLEPSVSVVVDPDAEYFTDDSDSTTSGNSQSNSSTDSHHSDESSDSHSSWGEDSLHPYAMNDDEEDLLRVPRPRTLRDCLSYLLTSENDDAAYDKHLAALTELPALIASKPLDLLDVVSTLLRVLLFLEDKFSMDQFSVKRWDSITELAVYAPMETCMILVGEMGGNISLGTRLEALAVLSGVAQELSGTKRDLHQEESPSRITDACYSKEVTNCSTRLQRVLNLQDGSNDDDDKPEASTQVSKTRRWRKNRTTPTTTTNRFGAVSVQMIYSLFAFLSQTRNDESIWGGSTGEKFLSEYLKTLATMLYCSRTYPNPALRVLATDLFDLAWSFHDARCAEVRCAALMALAVCMSMVPVEFVISRNSGGGLGTLMQTCSELDEDANCRSLAALVVGSMSEALMQIGVQDL